MTDDIKEEKEACIAVIQFIINKYPDARENDMLETVIEFVKDNVK